MKLNITKRALDKKCDVKKSRRAGRIPAILYRKGNVSEPILISDAEFQLHLRGVQKGRLSTTKFTLVDESGNQRIGIIKDIQYHITTYAVMHLDFEELIDDVKIKVNIPIECVGAADCPGVKLGGVLRPVIRHLKVECLPPKMPEVIEVDVREMSLKDYKKLADLNIPEGVKPLAKLDEVCIVIAKR